MSVSALNSVKTFEENSNNVMVIYYTAAEVSEHYFTLVMQKGSQGYKCKFEIIYTKSTNPAGHTLCILCDVGASPTHA